MTTEKKDRRGTPKGAGTQIGRAIATGAPAGRIGNPPFVPTNEQRQLVRTYAKVMSQQMIADALDISVDTLTRHFKREWSEGQREAVAAVGSKLLAKALSGNMTAMIFYLRTRGKWSQRVEVTGAEGGPIQHLDLAPILANYSEDQLALLEPLLEQLLTAAGIDIDGGDSLDAASSEGGEG